MADDLKVRAKFDGAEAEKGLNHLGDEGEKSANRIAEAYGKASKAVSGISAEVRRFQSMLGIFSQVSMAAFAVVELFQKARDAIANAGKAADDLADSARRAVEAASSAGGDLPLFTALKESAEAAGVPADELSRKLAEFREHKITFDELAASVGKTGDALMDAAEKAGNWNVGRRYLAERRSSDEAAAKEAEGWKAERAGIKEIVREIVRNGGPGGNGQGATAYWDMTAQAAGGDEARMRDIFRANRSWRDRLAGADVDAGYGDIAILDSAERYRAQGAANDRARAEEAAANDSAVSAARDEETERQMADFFAGLERIAEERAAAAARRADAIRSAEGRRDKGIAGAEDAAKKAREAIRVSAPEAVNEYARSGGLLGGESVGRALADMARERNVRLAEIQRRFDETVEKLEEGFRETVESLAE